MDAEVQLLELQGSKIWLIDNVLEKPNNLARFLFSRRTAQITGEPWSQNGKTYFKGRHFDFHDKAAPVVWLAQNLCGQTIDFVGGFKTNVEAWKDNNDYKTNYWFPHIDNGYNCIIYLNDNDDTGNGTNLYDPSVKDEEWFQKLMAEVPEGTSPWQPKEKFKLIKHIESKFNRMVLFDGNKFPHGTAVNNKQYFMDLDTAPRSMRSNVNFFYHPYDTKETS